MKDDRTDRRPDGWKSEPLCLTVIKMGFLVSSRIGQYLSSESDHSNIDKLAGKTTITNSILDSHWLRG